MALRTLATALGAALRSRVGCSSSALPAFGYSAPGLTFSTAPSTAPDASQTPAQPAPEPAAQKSDATTVAGPADDGKQKLYAGNLAWAVTSDDLLKLFSKYGTVHDAIVMRDRRTQLSRGYGFVTLDTEAAQKAMAELNSIDFNGRPIKVNPVQPSDRVKGDRPEQNKHRRYNKGKGGNRDGQYRREGNEWSDERPRRSRQQQ